MIYAVLYRIVEIISAPCNSRTVREALTVKRLSAEMGPLSSNRPIAGPISIYHRVAALTIADVASFLVSMARGSCTSTERDCRACALPIRSSDSAKKAAGCNVASEAELRPYRLSGEIKVSAV